MKFIYIFALLFIAALPINADEISPPDFEGEVIEFSNEHEISYRWDKNRIEVVEDRLVIGNIRNDGATIVIKTIGNNHHMCHVRGKVKKEQDRYLFNYRDCQLVIEHDDEQASVKDIDWKCQKHFCGRMGYLESQFKIK